MCRKKVNSLVNDLLVLFFSICFSGTKKNTIQKGNCKWEIIMRKETNCSNNNKMKLKLS